MWAISRDESGWKVAEAWSHKSQGYMSSPAVVADHIYLHLRNRRLVCLDVKTGAERWTTKPFGRYWSLVVNGQRLLALDQDGELRLIEASPEQFKLVSQRKVAEDSWAHIGMSGKQIFVRDLAGLRVFEWR